METPTRPKPRFKGLGPTRCGHPNEAVHNRLVYRVMEEVLAYAAGRYARGRLIDVGCGSKPWKGLFAPYVSEHIGVDIVPSNRDPAAVDVIAGAYDIPLEDASADTVLMTSVLEHLEEPGRAVAESRRLLSPGGHLIVTAPFIWPLHAQPRDFFRYTPHSLRFLLESAGLEVLEIEPLAGAWKTLALQLSYALRRYRRGVAAPAVDGVTMLVQWLGARWELVDFQPKFSWSHLAVARAPYPS